MEMINRTKSITENKQDLLLEWQRSLVLLHYGHNFAARYYSSLHLFLGFLVVVVTVIVGISIAINANTSLFAINLEVVLSFLAATIAGIQTFSNAKIKSERHNRAAAAFGKISRKFEQCLYFDKTDEATLNNIRDKWNNAIESAGNLPPSSYKRALRRVDAVTADA